MALDTTIGGASADSYVTLAEYEAYVVANIDLNFNGHGHDTTHEMNLRRGAQYIDRNYTWRGFRQYETQARMWPRLDVGIVDGWAIDGDEIPQRVKDAQCEIAYIMENESLDPMKTIKGVVKSAGAGPARVEFLGGQGKPRIVALEGLLRPLITGGSGQMQMVRG